MNYLLNKHSSGKKHLEQFTRQSKSQAWLHNIMLYGAKTLDYFKN